METTLSQPAVTDLSRIGKRLKRRILKENQGMLTRVAEECGVGVSAVSRTYWGSSKSARIERALLRRIAHAASLNGGSK